MISQIITRLTGRTYTIRREDIAYVIGKGAIPITRGALWSMVRFRRLCGLALGQGVQFIDSPRLHTGRGVAIGAFGYIDCSAEAGINLADRVTIRERAWIQSRSGLNERAAGLWIGERTYIGPNAVIGLGGPVHIGTNVQIGSGFTVTAESHMADGDGSFTSGHVSRRGIWIGNDCWLGNNVSILDGVKIGDGAVIGAGSIVTRSIPPRSVAYGVPAKVVRTVD
ncbi:MAG: acyltransferase [Sphingomonas sp.]|uniref:acyltransferase n=1 Tax=Sphingomonas sp. TaxID=28214 RepID=UPI00258AEC63|nr:acyltransferase [Sphingomonas sp.]MCP4028968.1 acyltransferase [Sphingomonas sp.]